MRKQQCIASRRHNRFTAWERERLDSGLLPKTARHHYIYRQTSRHLISTHGTATSIAASGHAFTPPPTVIIAISVDIERVLDLTVPAVRDNLGTDETELAGPWFEQMITFDLVPTHILARAAHLSNLFEGLKFNSVQKPGAVNLLVWPKKLKAPFFVEVNDPSRRLYQRIPK